jgi:hypothetical protein
MQTKQLTGLIAMIAPSVLAAPTSAAITWYLQLNGTNLASEVFQVVTNGELVDGQATAGSYTIQSIVSGSGQSSYVNFADTQGLQLSYTSSNGRGFDWNGTSATAFWSWFANGPFSQARRDGFEFQALMTNDSFTVPPQDPWDQPQTYTNTWVWQFGTDSRLYNTRYYFGEEGVTGGVFVGGGATLLSLTNPVPAPGAIALLGGAGLGTRCRRRR